MLRGTFLLVTAFSVTLLACSSSSAPGASSLDASAPHDAYSPPFDAPVQPTDAADAASTGGFPTAIGSSIWFDGLGEVVLAHRRTPVGPPLSLGDGGTLTHRPLTTAEADSLVAALRATVLVATPASIPSDADYATVTLSVGAASRTYADRQAFSSNQTVVDHLVDALELAHALVK